MQQQKTRSAKIHGHKHPTDSSIYKKVTACTLRTTLFYVNEKKDFTVFGQ